jgi:hypothetical protein
MSELLNSTEVKLATKLGCKTECSQNEVCNEATSTCELNKCGKCGVRGCTFPLLLNFKSNGPANGSVGWSILRSTRISWRLSHEATRRCPL